MKKLDLIPPDDLSERQATILSAASYDSDSYEADIIMAYKTYPTKSRGGFIRACGKRLRQGVAIRLLLRLRKSRFDITQTNGNRITKHLIGHGIDIGTLNYWFGTPGRSAQSKAEPSVIDEAIKSTAFRDAKLELKRAVAAASKARAKWQRKLGG